MSLAGVTVKKSVCAEKDCAIEVVECGWDDAIMQRGEIKKSERAADERQEQADSKAEAVEEGQGIEEPITFHQIDDGDHLTDVGKDIAMGEFNGLWIAFGAAGE